MGGLDCIWRFPNTQFHCHLCSLASPPPSSPSPRKTFLLFSPSSNTKISSNSRNAGTVAYTANTRTRRRSKNGRALTLRPPLSLPQNQQSQQQQQQQDDDDEEEDENEDEEETIAQGRGRGNWTIVLSSSLVGLLTGIGVVLFNYAVCFSLPITHLCIFAFHACLLTKF